ncbi:MAG: 1-deoxy-D-xylulose-5-phosphate synthase N-terminal domain-containing protein, partial [Methylococcaceae bacterium]
MQQDERLSYPLLSEIDQPSDLRAMSSSQLKPLAQELRDFLLYSVSQSGGH